MGDFGELAVFFWRTVFFYVLLLLSIRVMGKHNLGQLSPFDFVVTVMIADAAIIAVENPSVPLLGGVIPIVTLVILEMGLAFISLKSSKVRTWINGTPSVVIKDGKIQEDELRKLRYNIDDLLEQLRIQRVTNLADVAYALWEPSGQMSLVLRPAKRALQPADLGMEPHAEGPPATIIQDGVVDKSTLKGLGRGRKWLERELELHGLPAPKDILLASLDATGLLWVQARSRGGESGRQKSFHVSVSHSPASAEMGRDGGE